MFWCAAGQRSASGILANTRMAGAGHGDPHGKQDLFLGYGSFIWLLVAAHIAVFVFWIYMVRFTSRIFRTLAWGLKEGSYGSVLLFCR